MKYEISQRAKMTLLDLEKIYLPSKDYGDSFMEKGLGQTRILWPSPFSFY